MLHVSDIKGNVKLFYTSGSVNLTGKQKRSKDKINQLKTKYWIEEIWRDRTKKKTACKQII